MNEAQKIAENTVKSPVSGEIVKMKSLWKDQDCVIIFFRRFGCMFCRLAAKQLSEIKPKLDTKNVLLIGIGVEELGVEEFIKGGFFAGDLYIDINKQCYKDLEYKQHGVLSLSSALLYKSSRNAISEAKAANLGGDLKGDYYQVGGTMVVTKGGEQVIFNHKQKELADHADTKEILKCLNIE